MDGEWGGDPRMDDWLRGPGDREETRATAIRLGIDVASAAAALKAADEADERGDAQLSRVLLWIAASLGSRKAGFLLAEAIREWATAECVSDTALSFYTSMAETWDARSEGEGDAGLPGATTALRPGLARARSGGGSPGEPDAEGVVVVPKVGDAGTSEGSAISRRYAAVIGKKLPRRASMPLPGAVLAGIADEWPWAEQAARHIEGALELQRSLGLERPAMKPMLFLGPPGSGKTALARRVAELLGHPPLVVASGGTADSAGLGAVTRGWTSSRPCGPVIASIEMGCCDPAVIVDEVDKGPAVANRNGSASGALLGMLGEPSAFHDACLMAEVDLSAMLFMATANDLGSVHRALRDRFSVIVVGRPKPEHFDVVLGNLRRRAADRLGVGAALMPMLDAEEYGALRRHFMEAEGSLRDAERAYEFMLSEAVRREERSRRLQ